MENNLNNKINQIIKDANLTEAELKYLNQIIGEMSNNGNSKTLQQILDDIYIEVPVSFYQFITDDNYMGKALKDSATGKLTIYDYWVQTGINFFDKGKKYLELLLTGGTRLGKSFFAALCMAYKWYKVMCLKDPHSFYKLSTGTPIVAGFFNLKLDLAYRGMYYLFNNFLSLSPWFQKYGYIAGTAHPTYTPYNQAFQVAVASAEQSRQSDGFIGMNLYCITGDTQIETEKGIFKIEDLVNQKIRVYCVDNSGNKILSNNECEIIKTKETDELIELELEDGTIFRGTPEHRIMLKDGNYKQLKDLTEEDELFEI